MSPVEFRAMGEGAKVQLPWADIDTLLLDMDGTLLDLAFDNQFWLEVVPAAFAAQQGIGLEAAREEIHARYATVAGTLPWYCVEHWTDQLGLDIESLKIGHRHRIRYLPRAEEFLQWARGARKRLILVTNAHHVTLRIKCEQTGIDALMDAMVSSHDYGVEKERPGFWQQLAAQHHFEPGRTLVIEDNLTVLGTARDSGVRYAVAIRQPDTTQARREVEGFDAVDGVASLID